MTAASEANAGQQKGKTMTDEQYYAWLEAQRAARGNEWVDRKIAEKKKRVETRMEAYRKARDDAERLWMAQINAWSSSGGFEQVLEALALGEGTKMAANRVKYHVGTVPFEVNYKIQACTRWDGSTFHTGKKGSRGALGVAACVLELRGATKPFPEAKALVAQISGIPFDPKTQVTDEMRRKLAEMKAQQDAEAKRRKEEELREDPMTPEKQELAPRPITDPAAIEKLTNLMATERGFPIEYAKRLVREGTIFFGVFKFRGEDGQVVDSGRAMACSKVTGIATGTLVGYSSREFREYLQGDAKGKNIGAITKGVVVIGNWSKDTKRVALCEGVYDGAALRLKREKLGRPLGPDEAILVFGGSRVPERLLEECKKRGVEVYSAFDQDPAGRKMAKSTAEWCTAHGIKHTMGLPSCGEVTISLKDDRWGRTTYLKLAAKLARKKVKFIFQEPKAGRLNLTAETVDASCDIYAELKIAEMKSRPAPADGQDHDTSARLEATWHRKDWNELLQHPYSPVATATSGVPRLDPDGEAALTAYLEQAGFTPAEINAMRQALAVYPATVGGETCAVWPAVDPLTGKASGFRADSIRNGTKTECGAVGFSGAIIGDVGKARSLIISDSPACAVKTWRAFGKEALALVPLGDAFPGQMLAMAKDRQWALIPAFSEGDRKLEFEAGLTLIAQKNALKIGSVPRAKSFSGPDIV